LKCALLLKNMAQTLNMGDKDMQMTNALKLFGPEMIDLLYPDREPVGDPIVEKPGAWNFQNTVQLKDVPMALPDELIKITGLTTPDPTIGSNNWAVSGSKTKTGAPVLCNDPHLSTSLPSIWYVIHLNAPGINTMGASLPGAPGVISGWNDSIAWGVTNAQRDLVDWYAVHFDNLSMNRFLLDGEWIEARKIIEQFNVRGGTVFNDTVTYTYWGPVVYDHSYRSENNRKYYAFRWIAHDESEELMTFYHLNRGRNYDDYVKALDHFSSPAQNFVFASTSGDIAMRIQGKFPVRRKTEGKFILDGSKISSGWQAFIPNEQNVADKNPERGFVSSANQYPVDETYPYYVNAVSYEAYRNRRINNLLRAASDVTINDMMALQNDTYSIKAEESLPFMLSQLNAPELSTEEKAAYELLEKWDFFYRAESVAASYYDAWFTNLMPLIWDELRRDDLSLSTPTAWNTIHLMKTQPDLPFYDRLETPEKETLQDIVRLAFRMGVREVEDWKLNKSTSGREPTWAAFKDTYIEHLLRLEPLSRHVLHGGHGNAVNASSRKHGPSWRMIVSLEKDKPVVYATYPGGQSGNPGSFHYTSMLGRWSEGNYFRLMFPRNAREAAEQQFAITTLEPKK
ncbi:MAG: penicillin acylase family protein, partial [Cyclobacteriaceae bacterium]|nr:penicillin acylase family protein [Cyclobacteriaceae bacterium]